MTTAQIRRRINDLLVDPSEYLDIEIKTWLDISNNRGDQARLAKAAIALANHGGGIILIGFDETENAHVPSPNRPENLSGFSTDTVNAAIRRYSEPEFHCDAYIATSPEDGLQYPTVIVPGGHHAPIRSSRDGPDGGIIAQNAYYVRRPGPQSEPPRSGREWDTLIRRCIANARSDLLDQFRLLMSGGEAQNVQDHDETRLDEWHAQCLERWGNLIAQSSEDSAARFPHGYYAVSYILSEVPAPITGGELRNAVNRGTVRHSGWAPFWVPTRSEIEPYLSDGAIECWLGREAGEHDPAHADFWRVSPDGKFFLIRGYQEDGSENERGHPGTAFDITLPTWRMGEILLHAESMARQFDADEAMVLFKATWTGLLNRELSAFANPRRLMTSGYVSRQEEFTASIEVQANQISDTLPELVSRLVAPLYENFSFFQLPASLVVDELSSMRTNRF